MGSSPHARGAPTPSSTARPASGDHPRMRGEHFLPPVLAAELVGIIPACAGSTPDAADGTVDVQGSSPHARGALTSSFEILPLAWDHPRMRGEHLRLRAGVVHHVGGSSPHARGARDGRGVGLLCLRDHPRMRGEHWGLVAVPSTLQGIIPACAGSTEGRKWTRTWFQGSSPHARGALCLRQSQTNPQRDHPRMRGEHHHLVMEGRGDAGIIPACAGSTRRWHRPASSWGDHPRMRGEHPLSSEYLMYLTGIIPACAGSTFPPRPRRTTRSGSSPHARGAPTSARLQPCSHRDHPRMRGEHPRHRLLQVGNQRIIPACAGSTLFIPFWYRGSQGSSPHARGAPAQSFLSGAFLRDHPRMRGEH